MPIRPLPIDEHFDTFQQVYDVRYQAKYGFWRPVIEKSVKEGETTRAEADALLKKLGYK